jgi:radical SAM superfamily enzyme YgiQ (UPF0313 family)
MKILLVLPATAERRALPGRPVPRRAMLRFSVLSLTVVAALTPPEHEVSLVDENVEPLDLDTDADLVGISFMTALAPRAYELAAAFRARGRTVVAGGYHPTLVSDEVARHFDSVVVGEAEGQWPTLLEDFARGRLRPIYRRAWPCDPLQIPVPRRELTAATARHYVTTAAVQASRGCPHACSYCSIAAFYGSRLRTRPLAAVVNELRRLPRRFMFVDDNLIADREHARSLLRAIAPLNKRWVSQSSILIADDTELLSLARRAGCRGLFIGLESLDAGNLGAVGKSFNRALDYGRRLAAIRRAGIGVVAGIIVGMDQDDRAVFERTLSFLDRHRVDALQLNILTPLPGTPLFEQFRREGRILDPDWSHYDFRQVVIRPGQMTPEELQAGADWLYREFYRPQRILRRFVSGLVTLGPLAAWLALRLNLTYLRDNRADGIVGWNPARARCVAARPQVPTARSRPVRV